MHSKQHFGTTERNSDKERTEIAENHERLEQLNSRLWSMAEGNGGGSCKRGATNSDDDGEQWTEVKGRNRRSNGQDMSNETGAPSPSKKQRVGHAERHFFRRNNHPNQRIHTQPIRRQTQNSPHASPMSMNPREDGGDCQTTRFEVTSQALSYATDIHLPPIKIECEPGISTKDIGKNLAVALIREIEQDFRRQYQMHRRAIGFDHWWIDLHGHFNGITKDVDFYVYLCDEKRYPPQLDNIRLKPLPAKRLPPQNTTIINFVPNEIDICELEEVLRRKYASTFKVEQMMGTMRSMSRHVRVDFWDKKDYEAILNSGKVAIAGQLLNVDEYLAAPKILICSYCNGPGHMKKNCKAKYEVCRRCGGNRADAQDHKKCLIRCHHCGGDHLSTSYQCPTMIAFRQDMIIQLKKSPEMLPVHVQLFIPVDCRQYGDKERILGTQAKTKRNIDQQPTNPWTQYKGKMFSPFPSVTTATTVGGEYDVQSMIKDFSYELQQIKTKFDEERNRVMTKHDNQLKLLRDGWLLMQQHLQLQDQRMDSFFQTIKDDYLLPPASLYDSIRMLCELVKKTASEDERVQIEQISKQVALDSEQRREMASLFYQHQQQLIALEKKQTTAFDMVLETLSTTAND